MRVPHAAASLIAVLLLANGCVRMQGGLSTDRSPPDTMLEYRVYVANESSDLVSRIVFDLARGARVEREIPIGIMPADTDGPHGVAVSPDGAFLYVTVAHGTPNGWIWKLHAGPDTVVARSELGRFPASVSSTADGRLLLVSNFNLHGDPVPSDVSVVFAPELTELSRIRTCVTPHGSAVSTSGDRHYSVCMRSDQLVEIDLARYRISQRFSVRPGAERPIGMSEDGSSSPTEALDPICSPTWVTPGVGGRAGRFVYVACNRADVLLEVDVSDWTVARRFATGRDPYNLAITPDGARLIVTLRGSQGVAGYDLGTGRRVADIETSRPYTHGVVVSPDGRFAFVTNEGLGSARGTLDVLDLVTFERVATLELQHQPGGIAFWRADALGRGPSVVQRPGK